MTAVLKTESSNADDAPRFGFGKNWDDFIKHHFSEERVNISANHILGFLKTDNLKDKTFLDIGCGSGLHSLAAYKSGAKEIFGFDYDQNSVDATKRLHQWSGSPQNWSVTQGSVLDESFINSLPLFDIVYSWGVLHHTGDQWNAIRLASTRVKPGGLFYIALYTSDVYEPGMPEYWLDVKKRYNNGGWFTKRKMEAHYITKNVLGMIRSKQNPLDYILNYKKSRGMSYYTDVKDWLGGWPMEFSSIADVKSFCQEKLGFNLINIKTGEANTEYLFQKL